MELDPQPGGNELSDLARSLDCLTRQDLCRLAKITLLTEEAWRKRGTGPEYTRIGNTVLYPRDKLAEYLRSRVRKPRGRIEARDVL